MVVFIVAPKNSGLQYYKNKVLSSLGNNRVIDVRGEDVPFWVEQLISNGKQSIGLIGEDLFNEYSLKNKTNLVILDKIEWNDPKALFKKPTLCLLGPKKLQLSKNITIIISKKYQFTAEKYLSRFQKQGYKLRKIYVAGCVETGCSEGIADFVIDIVYTGSSLNKYKLRVYDIIAKSDFLIIGGRND